MICLAYVTGPNRCRSPEQAAAKIEYQPLPETAVGGKAAETEDAAKAAEAPAAPHRPSRCPGRWCDFDKMHSVIQERCTVCHSAKPTSPLFSAAPAGVMFDTRSRSSQAARIQAQAVASQIMPLGNITQMTSRERKLDRRLDRQAPRSTDSTSPGSPPPRGITFL
jgi:uncharacterized membrane protein